MELSQLHFAHPLWLWTTLGIPLLWVIYNFFHRINNPFHQLNKFIDSHLLPYLLVNNSKKTDNACKHLLLWTAVWSLLAFALAGPRWDFKEIETFSKDQSLVILLDLSESMNASDIKPSRLVRAKQKIEDLINISNGVKIGLIAFAADPHMIAPLTEDAETIRHLLSTLDTDLVHVQGSKLSPALDMAATILEAAPGSNKALLVISDGGFEDASAIITAKNLAAKGIVINAMGIGTIEGSPVIDHEGNTIKKNGTPIISRLEKERFSEISKIGNGRFLEAHYSDHDENIILKELDERAKAQIALGKKNQLWDERFYLLIFPTLPIILWWFRRGYILVLMLMFSFQAIDLRADAADYFKNSEQLGKQAMDQGDYETAIHTFQDSYRKGVACYKAGDFAEAEKLFRQSSRVDAASSAGYNLGNALVQQQKFKEAIEAYENVLQKWPDHIKAKENLELVKKMLEQQKQQDADSEDSDQKDGGDPKDQSKKQSKDKQKNENNESNEDGSGKKSESDHQDSSGSEDESKPNCDKGKQDDKQSNEQENETQGMNEKGDSSEEKKGTEEAEDSQKEKQDAKGFKSEEDQDADFWLNRIANDPKTFMKNKFTIESKRNGTTEGIDPW